MTTRETLTKAADLIEQAPKLAKGSFEAPAWVLDDNGYEMFDVGLISPPRGADLSMCYCALGAIRETYALHGPGVEVLLESFRTLAGVVDDGAFTTTVEAKNKIYAWNDDPDRTKAEVVAALRKAAEL